jgi:hypothetical protein
MILFSSERNLKLNDVEDPRKEKKKIDPAKTTRTIPVRARERERKR